MKVPFSNLYLSYKTHKKEIDHEIDQVIQQSAFSDGPFVEKFEKHFTSILGSKYCIGVNSGTSALHLSLWALGIGKEDEVIVPTFTFFATPEAVSLTGAKPVFIDSEQTTGNIDADQIERLVGEKTKAVIVVHLYGQPVNIKKISKICEKYKLHLIEDCAQAHLSQYRGKTVGNFGICGCFSFYPSKNLGAFGEAGAIVTSNKQLYRKILSMRSHGSMTKYKHQYIGHNYRMEGIQAAVLNVKLKYLRETNKKRRDIANQYFNYLKDIPELFILKPATDFLHTYHQYVLLTEKRDDLQKYLWQHGIETSIHYPIPCHLQEAYSYLGYKKDSFPRAERLANIVLSLPMYPELTQEQVKIVGMRIKQFFNDEANKK